MEPSQQVAALELFTQLTTVRDAWSGALLLGIGLDHTGRAMAVATLAAGAAGLFLESDRQNLRTAQREGCCTFSVSTLEEAIRILKNELRQRRAVTVALGGDPSVWLAESVHRGLQPEVIFLTGDLQGEETTYLATLLQRGSIAFPGPQPIAPVDALALQDFTPQLPGTTWRIAMDTAATMVERRARDSELLAEVESIRSRQDDRLVRAAARWLRTAPSLFPRTFDRAYLAEAILPH